MLQIWYNKYINVNFKGINMIKNILEMQNVTKKYKQRKALDSISFNIQRGHIVGLLGPNGAGKSTTMRVIVGLTDVFAGSVIIKNRPVSLSNHQALDSVGNLIEYPALYQHMTAEQHIKLYSRELTTKTNVNMLMSRTGIDKFGRKKISQYSLGMKQRLGIALALLRNPELVILDEPFNGLDPQSVHDIRALIRQLADEGTSFLISSHQLAELQKLIDDVVIIDHGTIIKQGTMAELFAKNKQTWHIETDNNQIAVSAFTGEQLSIDNIKIILTTKLSLEEIVNRIKTTNAELIDIERVQDDLEASLLKILEKENKSEEQ